MSSDINVSRETQDRLEKYQALLVKWQARINLVAPDTLADSWNRHFVDSLQIIPFLTRGDEAENGYENYIFFHIISFYNSPVNNVEG